MRPLIILFLTLLSFVFPAPASAATSLNLTTGWNLLGNSSALAIDTATTFGDAGKITTVWKWNKSASKWAFYAPSMTPSAMTAYAQDKGYDVLGSIAPKEGFWVNASAAVALSVPTTSGVVSTPPQPGVPLTGQVMTLVEGDLQQGWNLLGSADNKTPPQLNQGLSGSLNAAGKTILTAWAWDAQNTKWKFYAPSLEAQGGTALADYISGKGYLPFSAAISAADGFWLNIGTPANNQPAAVAGSCGSSNNSTVVAAPGANLCTAGTASGVSGTGPWSWACQGSNGGANASCSANKQPPAVAGSCGSSNNSTFAAAPSGSNLCTAGTASGVSGTDPWTWTCQGSNGGANASCLANKLTTAAIAASTSATYQGLTTKALVDQSNVDDVTTRAYNGTKSTYTLIVQPAYFDYLLYFLTNKSSFTKNGTVSGTKKVTIALNSSTYVVTTVYTNYSDNAGSAFNGTTIVTSMGKTVSSVIEFKGTIAVQNLSLTAGSNFQNWNGTISFDNFTSGSTDAHVINMDKIETVFNDSSNILRYRKFENYGFMFNLNSADAYSTDLLIVSNVTQLDSTIRTQGKIYFSEYGYFSVGDLVSSGYVGNISKDMVSNKTASFQVIGTNWGTLDITSAPSYVCKVYSTSGSLVYTSPSKSWVGY